MYLAGAVHLLTADYYPIDPAFDRAFDQSDLLVEELDMQEMLAPESQMLMLTRGMLPSGQSLQGVVSAETYAAVAKNAASLGLPLAPLTRFKPWALALTLQALEWQKAGFSADLGLDRHFFDKAKAAGKPVQGLETLEFQISRFDGLPPEAQDRLLMEALNEIQTLQASFKTLADAWKSGDTATVERIVLRDLKAEPEIYARLLIERNRTWLPKIEALFARPTSSLVVVGAAHLIGTDGLLELLKAKGYRIEQM